MGEDITARWDRFRLMSQSVVCIGYVVGLQNELQDVHEKTGFCAWARCADPVQREILLFACDECGVTYCSRNCLARDWMYGDMRKWHRLSCGNVFPLKVNIPWGFVDRMTRALTEGPNRFPIENFLH